MKRTLFNTSALAISGLMMAVLVAGCSMKPAYERPDSTAPAAWPEQTAASQNPGVGVSISVLDWQDFVLDMELRQLVDNALEHNHDLREAVLNIEAARAQYRIQRSDRLPGIDGQAGSTSQRIPASLNGTGDSSNVTTYQVGLGVTAYELDLFGRVRDLSEAALESYFATEEAARATKISLIAGVIQAYISRAGAQERHDLTKQTFETRQVSLDIISKQRKVGSTSDLDYLEAKGLAEQAQADLEVAARELAQTDNGLALLTGVPVEQLPKPKGTDNRIIQEQLAPGLPSELLTRRPDILAAEHRLIASNANIGAARAAFYPRITLTGSFGTASGDLADLFSSGSTAWQFMPQLNLPIFNYGSNKANLNLNKVRNEISIVQYEKAIESAFREVADALVDRETFAREENARKALAESSSHSLQLSEARYRHGVDSHLRYLDAQRRDFTNQLGLIQTRTQRQIALVNLFRALGGGWDPSHTEPVASVD
ncbi:efflux transporter outer membrane subunit [Desulfosediminicola ganghwensis]|uniref:efflux transporter outer membrane subunit n=1 Tax=Desulfosediminicola ganghwensis TaxID=2569540 RepID=UPI0010ABF070|nr:efflux transporter outer membrane subunit [Desulfosediminicola ganghwensis]